MSMDLVSRLGEELLRSWPDKGVQSAQISGAVKTALDAQTLVNALAEGFRVSPGEMEEAAAALRKLEEQGAERYRREYEDWAAGLPKAEGVPLSGLSQSIAEVAERWTKACISWYEIHEGF